MEECKLRLANGIDGDCDTGSCTYWRVVEHLDLGVDGPPQGCAVQFFGLLEGGDSDLAAWLLSVKERVERTGQ